MQQVMDIEEVLEAFREKYNAPEKTETVEKPVLTEAPAFTEIKSNDFTFRRIMAIQGIVAGGVLIAGVILRFAAPEAFEYIIGFLR
jgi:hypothetical protein